jgi:hypothetical protein
MFRKNQLLKKKYKSVRWSIPGSLKEGIIFDPMYVKHACSKAESIFNEYSDRDDIHLQEICFSDAYTEMESFIHSNNKKNKKNQVQDTLFKNQDSYQSYLGSLSSNLQRLIKKSWKVTQIDLELNMGDYSSFKEIFAYKSEGAKQYKECKNHSKLLKYLSLNQETYFLTLESSSEVKAIIPYIKGQGHHTFYDVLMLDESIPETIPHQLAIVKFYDLEDCDRLHFLGETKQQDHFLDLGYTSRNQYFVSIEKS